MTGWVEDVEGSQNGEVTSKTVEPVYLIDGSLNEDSDEPNHIC